MAACNRACTRELRLHKLSLLLTASSDASCSFLIASDQPSSYAYIFLCFPLKPFSLKSFTSGSGEDVSEGHFANFKIGHAKIEGNLKGYNYFLSNRVTAMFTSLPLIGCRTRGSAGNSVGRVGSRMSLRTDSVSVTTPCTGCFNASCTCGGSKQNAWVSRSPLRASRKTAYQQRFVSDQMLFHVSRFDAVCTVTAWLTLQSQTKHTSQFTVTATDHRSIKQASHASTSTSLSHRPTRCKHVPCTARANRSRYTNTAIPPRISPPQPVNRNVIGP